MERVTGIGGIFFKAQDPSKLAEWYRRHLGIENEGGFASFLWREHGQPDGEGRTVWSLFPADTAYFGASPAPFMVNYRVADLARMLEQLKQAGIAIERVEESEYGKFAWLSDSEGNRLELWEPPAA